MALNDLARILPDEYGDGDADIIVEVEGPNAPKFNDDGYLETETEDGGVVIDFSQYLKQQTTGQGDDGGWTQNLAAHLTAQERSRIVEELLEQIEADDLSRAEWLATRAEAIHWLGLRLESPKAADIGASSAPAEGLSTYKDTLLVEATLRGQATASGELLPANGPVKVKEVGAITTDVDTQARDLQRDMNHWLTDIAREYVPDTKRMLFWTVFGGAGFKKGIHCPIRRRPVIESVDAQDVIVSSDATDLQTAARVTHKIKMRRSIMRRMQVLGEYLDEDLPPALNTSKSAVEEAEEAITGVREGEERPEDRPFELFESYCECEIDQFAPTEYKGKRIQLPWVATIDRENRRLLSLKRDWEKDDPATLRKQTWVRYPYIEALGIYGVGQMHLVGNTTIALSAAAREALDAGMLANFPGFLVAKWATRQNNLTIRVGPTEGQIIDTGERPIGEAVMKMPYGDVTAGLMTMMEKIDGKGQRVAGVADLPVGEGRQDAPVGTTIALIEQATKVESAVHKGLHQAQSEEFRVLVRLLREDPESFCRHTKDMNRKWEVDSFLRALENTSLEPVSDPNTPSHIHRLMRAVAIKQLQAQSPQIYNAKEVDRRILTEMGIDDVDSLFVPDMPPVPPPPDPKLITANAKMMDSQTKEKKLGLDAAKVAHEGQARMAEIAGEQQLEQQRFAKEELIHNNDAAQARHDMSLATDQHALDVAKHNLDVQTAAHDAAMDVHAAQNPPLPGGP